MMRCGRCVPGAALPAAAGIPVPAAAASLPPLPLFPPPPLRRACCPTCLPPLRLPLRLPRCVHPPRPAVPPTSPLPLPSPLGSDQIFRRMHAAYVDAVSNPFYQQGAPLASRRFDVSIRTIATSLGAT